MNANQMKSIATQISRLSPSELNALASLILVKASDRMNLDITFPLQVVVALTIPRN